MLIVVNYTVFILIVVDRIDEPGYACRVEDAVIEIDGRNYLTVQEVCARLGVKPATIYAYVSRGILRSYRQGIKRQRLYRADDVDALLTLHLGSGISERGETPDRARPSVEPEIREERDDKLPAADGWMGEM